MAGCLVGPFWKDLFVSVYKNLDHMCDLKESAWKARPTYKEADTSGVIPVANCSPFMDECVGSIKCDTRRNTIIFDS